jgi:hypothetical protein
LAAIALLIIGTAPAAAAGDASSDKWKYGLEVYLWGASVGGASAAGEDIDISFEDLVDDLQMGFMSAFGARKAKWSLLADVVYLDVDDGKSTTANVAGNPIQARGDVELKGWVVNAAGGYNVVETGSSLLDVLVGVRYLDLETDLTLDLGNAQRSVSGSGSVWDGIVGLKGRTELSDKWHLNYYVDVGTGDSDFTWQALGAFGYHLKKVDLSFGYRYLEWDFDDNDAGGKVFNDLNFHGPFAGVTFKW